MVPTAKALESFVESTLTGARLLFSTIEFRFDE